MARPTMPHRALLRHLAAPSLPLLTSQTTTLTMIHKTAKAIKTSIATLNKDVIFDPRDVASVTGAAVYCAKATNGLNETIAIMNFFMFVNFLNNVVIIADIKSCQLMGCGYQ